MIDPGQVSVVSSHLYSPEIMKSILSALSFALASRLVNAHYTFPDLITGTTVAADWQYVRRTDNYNTQAPVTDVTTPQIKCYENATAAQTSTITVSAGSTVGFKADQSIYHPGYYSAYLSSATDAGDEDAGNGQTWFKIWEDPPTYTPGSTTLNFPQQNELQFTFTIPAATPSGQYLVRGEQIALHVASTYGGAQFYLACGQLNIINGGNGSPGPLVSFPGAYTGYEPGILIDIYNIPANYPGYTSPGPAVWTGSGSSGSSPTSSSAPAHGITTTAKSSSVSSAKSSSTPKTSSTSTSSVYTGTLAAHYAQCGGTGWTGPTQCAAPYKCTVSNTYYSQCL